MRTSRRLVLMTITFLVVVLVAEMGARALEPRLPDSVVWDSPFAQAKAESARALGRVDIAVVGSSIGNVNVDVTGVLEQVTWATDGYNASVPAEAPGQWVVWAQDVVFPDLCPTILLIAVGPRDMNDNKPGADQALEQYRNSQGRLALYGAEGMAASISNAAQKVSALISVRERLRQPANVIRYLRDGSTPGWPNLNLAQDGRYRGFDDDPAYAANPERDEVLRTGALAEYEVGPIEFAALEQLVGLARSQSVTPVFVDMPYLREELAGVVDDGLADLDRYDRAIAELADRLDVPLLQYPEMADDVTLFSDQYHMSRLGATEISGHIGAELNSLFPEPPQSPSCAMRDPDRIP